MFTIPIPLSGAFLAKCIDNFRPSLRFLVPPPFSSTFPDKPPQSNSAVEPNPRVLGLTPSFIFYLFFKSRLARTPFEAASYHQFQRFVLHLRLHVDDPPRNSLWKWKPSPASAARKCRDVIHFAQPHGSGKAVSTGRVGGGERPCCKATRWLAEFCLKRRQCEGSSVSDWLRMLPRLSPVTPPNKRANGWRCCCYPEEYTEAKINKSANSTLTLKCCRISKVKNIYIYI